ncbi:MAG: protein kinase [Oscillospiraceae bacterium]|nr:protein kinase [Oscillospiraceae bacterium]
MSEQENNIQSSDLEQMIPTPETEEAAAPAEESAPAPVQEENPGQSPLPEQDEPEASEQAPAEPETAEEAPAEPEAAGETPAEPAPDETPAQPEKAAEDPGEPTPASQEHKEKGAGEGGSYGLSGIRVAMELCDRVYAAVGPTEFHGGVRPDNISVKDGQVFLGSVLRHGVGEFTPQELEYMAPELFWDGVRSPTADVYSLGLVLYSIYNYGRLPFWPSSGAVTPNARASALQKRMSDETLTPPAKADAELSAVILRALSFRVEERWQDVQELKLALSTCDESSSPVDISLAMSGLLTRAAEADPLAHPPVKTRTYYDESEIRENRRPKRRRNLGWLWILILGLLAVSAAVLLMTTFSHSKDPAQTGPAMATAAPTPEPLATPVPTEAPTPTPEPTEKPHGPQYVVHVENVSWEQAVQRCKDLGGTLAIPATEEEYKELIRVCTSARINYVWLGASRQADGNWATVDGEPMTFFNWGNGEPSFTDSGDGAAEDYLMMWRSDENWPYNDSRENPLDKYGWIYGGAIGYVCKMW